MNKARVDEWLKADKIIYTGDFGFAYTEADKNSQEVSDLVLGDLLELTGEEGEFYGVKFPDGREGYVSKEEAEKFEEWKKSREPNAKNILDRAFTFMGRPYLWGGTSSKGIDCSGFTKTIYMSQGVILPRDASQQVFTGNSIDEGENFENLKPGDLLFFGRKAEDGKKERVTHVGIYIGDKEFIHASGIVKVNSFDKNASNFSEYRLKGFLRARRILNSVNQNGITTFDTNSFFKGDF